MMSYGQALKVDASGNVGINQANPTSRLHVVSSDLFIGNLEGSGPTARLKVNHTGSNSGLLFATGGTNRYSAAAYQAGGGLIDFTFYNDQNATASLLIDGNTNNAVFAGSVTAAGGFITSDRRLKNGISEYTGGLEEVLKIKPVTFSYKPSEMNKGMDSRPLIGVVAQDFAKIEPIAVRTYTHNVVGENMIPTGETVEYLQLQSDAVQYMLVNAIKEQQKQIEEKDEKILDLENRLLLIESKLDGLVSEKNINLGSSSRGTIDQNSPNPFANSTQISYSIPENSTSAELNIFDIHGRLMKSVDLTGAGIGQLNIQAGELPTGIYSYQLVVDQQIIDAKKMIKN